jgi:hypothetical protein
MTIARIATLLFALFLAACAQSGDEARLERTFDFTVKMLRDVERNPVAAAAYQSALEGGGTPVSYVVFGMPPQSDFSELEWQGPEKPWTIVIKQGPGETALVVEAYGADASKPVRSETVDLAPQ